MSGLPVQWLAATWCTARTVSGACTAAASLTAQSSACCELSEPSMPTTTPDIWLLLLTGPPPPGGRIPSLSSRHSGTVRKRHWVAGDGPLVLLAPAGRERDHGTDRLPRDSPRQRARRRLLPGAVAARARAARVIHRLCSSPSGSGASRNTFMLPKPPPGR